MKKALETAQISDQILEPLIKTHYPKGLIGSNGRFE